MSCSRGQTGVYHVVNYTLGEQWNLLRRFAWWMVGLRLVPILLVAGLTADLAQDSFHASTARSVLWAVIVGVLTAVVLAVRYGRRHAVPLWKRRSSVVETAGR
jgi:DMSO/TMAO reductase YedYZ heme-binding membrane subunit